MKRSLILIAIVAVLAAACGDTSFTMVTAPAHTPSAPAPTHTLAATVATSTTLPLDPLQATDKQPVATATVVPPTATQPLRAPTSVPTATLTATSRDRRPTATYTPTATATATAASTATILPTPRPLVARYADTPAYGGVNLRQGPSTASAIIQTLPYGARVVSGVEPVVGSDGAAWFETVYRGKSGYVLATLLSSHKPEPQPTATSTPAPTVTPIPLPMATPTQVPTATPPQQPVVDDEGTWTLTAVGDMMLSRTVLRRMEEYGSYRHPFVDTADVLRAADFTVANLEGQVSDRVAPSSNPETMYFVSPAAVLDGVRWAGIDAVSLANNHALDFGPDALVDTMDAVKASGLGYFGAGSTRQSSLRASVYNIGGQRVAFLGFTDLSNMGFPHASVPTTAPAFSPEQVAGAVRAADDYADVVIPYFHWGVEYVSVPNKRQQSLAYAAIDAGADLVLGAHPHWVQETERYQGVPIVYSLGNFVFDQMWSTETRQGVIATITFAGAQVTDVQFTPVVIEDYNRPRIATGADRQGVLNRMGVTDSGD